MILTLLQLKAIARSGGGLSLDASLFTMAQLRAIIQEAKAGGNGSVALRNVAGMNAGQLTELAKLAPGSVSFEI